MARKAAGGVLTLILQVSLPSNSTIGSPPDANSTLFWGRNLATTVDLGVSRVEQSQIQNCGMRSERSIPLMVLELLELLELADLMFRTFRQPYTRPTDRRRCCCCRQG